MMKAVGRKMGLMMAVTMSFCLSLSGLLSAGKFTVPSFIINFAISFVISLIIGLCVPMGKVNAALGRAFHIQPGSLKARCIESLVSDLIYTPIITITMITMAYRQATSHGAHLNYGRMVVSGLLLSMVLGYIIIFIVSPIFMKIAMKGVQPPAGQPPVGGPPRQ